MTEELNHQPAKSKAPTHVAYIVSKGDKANFWDRVGVAWQNEKYTSIQLKAVPLDGRITLRPINDTK